MINTLFASHLIESKGRTEPDISPRQTTEIHGKSQSKLANVNPLKASWPVVITENGVRLKLNIVDTPGYGDMINNDNCWDPIVKYVSPASRSALRCQADDKIKDQHSAYLRKELTALRDRHIADTRIHCCLFFINPTGHTLKPVGPSPSETSSAEILDRHCGTQETRRGRQCRPCYCQVWLVDLRGEIPVQAKGKLHITRSLCQIWRVDHGRDAAQPNSIISFRRRGEWWRGITAERANQGKLHGTRPLRYSWRIGNAPFCCCRLGTKCSHWRQVSKGQKEPMGSHQCRRWTTLWIRLPPKLPYQVSLSDLVCKA